MTTSTALLRSLVGSIKTENARTIAFLGDPRDLPSRNEVLPAFDDSPADVDAKRLASNITRTNGEHHLLPRLSFSHLEQPGLFISYPLYT